MPDMQKGLNERTIRLAFDPVLMRPACVLMAAAVKADRWAPHKFPSELWLTAPTPDMAIYMVSKDELAKLVKMAVAKATGGAQ